MTEKPNQNDAGIIRPDDSDERILSDLVEADENQTSVLPGRVVTIIVVVALVWIIILGFFVARMPTK
jgi:hypothetical protein